MSDRFLSQCFLHFECRTPEAHYFLADSFLDNFIETDKGAAANKQNFLCINLDVFLVRMFTAALRRNIARAAFEDFQKRLLNSLAGNVAGDGNVVSLTTDLIDLVDVNNADLGPLHIVIRILQQAQNDVLDIFSDITSLSQRRRIGDAKRYIENLRQRFSQQCLARARGPDEENITLFNLNLGEGIRLKGGRRINRR